MDYKILHKQTAEIVAAEEKVKMYGDWLDRLKRDKTVTGVLMIGSTVFKRSSLRIELTQHEMQEILSSRMSQADHVFIRARNDFEKQNK